VKKAYILVSLIILLAAFLRFFRLEENLSFHAELGDNYLVMKNYVAHREIPLVGPPTSHPWLSFGPFYYWIFTPILMISNWHPVGPAIAFAIIGTFTVLLNYWFVTKIANKKSALVSSLLIALSPLWLSFTRESRFFVLIATLIYPYFILVYSYVRKKTNNLFWIGLSLGVMLNFHYAPIILVPSMVILILFYKRKPAVKDVITGIVGTLLPLTPLIIHNLSHKSPMLVQLIVWFPYRILGFFGASEKIAVDAPSLTKSIEAFITFAQLNFSATSSFLAILFVMAILVYILFPGNKSLHNHATSIIVVHLIVAFMAIVIHQNVPLHYFLPIFPIPIVFFSMLVTALIKHRMRIAHLLGIATALGVWILIGVNSTYFFSDRWFYQPQDRNTREHPYPFALQQNVVNAIVADASGRPFTLSRVGSFDYYTYAHAQHYRYLLWWEGNEPLDTPQVLSYTVYDDIAKLPVKNHQEKVLWVSNVAIVKNE